MRSDFIIIFSLEVEATAEEGGPHMGLEVAVGRMLRGTGRTRGPSLLPTENYRDNAVTQSQNLHSLQSLYLP